MEHGALRNRSHPHGASRLEPRKCSSDRHAGNTTFAGPEAAVVTRTMRDGESAVVTPLSPKACWLFFCARSWDRLWVAKMSPAPCVTHRPEAFAPAPARSPYRQRSSVRASTRRWACRLVSDSSPAAGLWPVRCAEALRRLVSTFVGLLTSAIFWLSCCAPFLPASLRTHCRFYRRLVRSLLRPALPLRLRVYGRVGRPPA
jgi:hypothetical protein